MLVEILSEISIWCWVNQDLEVMKLIDLIVQVLADEGKAKAVAFDEIDKAPEEKKRGITIATVRTKSFTLSVHTD